MVHPERHSYWILFCSFPRDGAFVDALIFSFLTSSPSIHSTLILLILSRDTHKIMARVMKSAAQQERERQRQRSSAGPKKTRRPAARTNPKPKRTSTSKAGKDGASPMSSLPGEESSQTMVDPDEGGGGGPTHEEGPAEDIAEEAADE